MKTARMKKSEAVIALSAGLIALIIVFAALLVAAHLSRPETSYSSSEVSSYDFNGNGLSDAMDLVLGARADAENHPTYDGRYWQGGYPPDNIGVCTDVVWRAFRAAGYSLRDMVDADIAARPSAYPNVTQRDSNIDFRRVKNLRVFPHLCRFPHERYPRYGRMAARGHRHFRERQAYRHHFGQAHGERTSVRYSQRRAERPRGGRARKRQSDRSLSVRCGEAAGGAAHRVERLNTQIESKEKRIDSRRRSCTL